MLRLNFGTQNHTLCILNTSIITCSNGQVEKKKTKLKETNTRTITDLSLLAPFSNIEEKHFKAMNTWRGLLQGKKQMLRTITDLSPLKDGYFSHNHY